MTFRSVLLVQLGLVSAACAARTAYVSVPMVAVSSSPAPMASAPADDGGAALSSAFLPIPAEPAAPPRASGCRRELTCYPEENRAAQVSYPPPFERCPPDRGKSGATFSAKETRDARLVDSSTCCYLAYLGCGTRPR